MWIGKNKQSILEQEIIHRKNSSLKALLTTTRTNKKMQISRKAAKNI